MKNFFELIIERNLEQKYEHINFFKEGEPKWQKDS